LGFDISDKAVKRAGLDYWPMVELQVYENLDHFFTVHPKPDLWLATTKAPRDYTQAVFRDNCWLMFGKETAGLPENLRLTYYDRCVRIPMRPDARSLNLANSVAVLAYEALRQQGFPGLSGEGEMVNSQP
jgi:tRNA (cytidine/uridine-2'-O-)-methyltransferase